jgi:hypothetical protein
MTGRLRCSSKRKRRLDATLRLGTVRTTIPPRADPVKVSLHFLQILGVFARPWHWPFTSPHDNFLWLPMSHPHIFAHTLTNGIEIPNPRFPSLSLFPITFGPVSQEIFNHTFFPSAHHPHFFEGPFCIAWGFPSLTIMNAHSHIFNCTRIRFVTHFLSFLDHARANSRKTFVIAHKHN